MNNHRSAGLATASSNPGRFGEAVATAIPTTTIAALDRRQTLLHILRQLESGYDGMDAILRQDSQLTADDLRSIAGKARSAGCLSLSKIRLSIDRLADGMPLSRVLGLLGIGGAERDKRAHALGGHAQAGAEVGAVVRAQIAEIDAIRQDVRAAPGPQALEREELVSNCMLAALRWIDSLLPRWVEEVRTGSVSPAPEPSRWARR